MRTPIKRSRLAALLCGSAIAVLMWAQGPHKGGPAIRKRTPILQKKMPNAAGQTVSGPGAATPLEGTPQPTETGQPVAGQSLAMPPAGQPVAPPQSNPTAPGTMPSPPQSALTGGGAPAGVMPPPLGLAPGVGAAGPDVDAPDLGGVLGPGATPNPGGIPAPLAPAGEEQYLFMGPPNPEHGKELIRAHGCGQCHTIAGIREAVGKVGPPLTGVASRVYIAGVLQNSMANRARWIENPQAFVPNVVMPYMGISRAEAQDISAYLEQLR